MVVARISFQAAVRAAAVSMLTAFKDDAGIKLQVYAGRPSSLWPPSAFVDRMTESIVYPNSVTWRQRTVRAEVLVIFGLFDSAEAVAQKDDFVDAFMDWVTDDVHAAGPNTTIALVAVDDEPAWTPDWRPANVTNGPNPTYYATRLTLEGFAGG
jgi:hypothetical protein